MPVPARRNRSASPQFGHCGGSFTDAVAAARVSQPTVSQAVKRLERRLGAELPTFDVYMFDDVSARDGDERRRAGAETFLGVIGRSLGV